MIVLFIFLVPPFMSSAISLSDDPLESEFTLPKSFCFVAGAMTIARGWSVTPRKTLNRIFFFSIMLGGSLVYWHWEAMIISYLAVRTTVLPFKSMEDMALNTNYKVLVMPGTSYVDTFRYGHTDMLRNIYADRIGPYIESYPKSKLALSEMTVSDPGFALFDNFYATITYEPYKSCQIIAIPVAYFRVQFAYAFQKKSPYFDAFWHQLNKMKERGMIGQILDKYAEEPQICPDYSGKPLGFGQCFTAFIVLMGGMAIGLIGFVLEMVLKIIPSNMMPRISLPRIARKKKPDIPWAHYMRTTLASSVHEKLEYHKASMNYHNRELKRIEKMIRPSF